MSDISQFADRVAKTKSYSGEELGGPIRRCDQPVGTGRFDHRVVLISEARRDLIVAALRAFDGNACEPT